ncbi:MAG: hypothetical protein SFU83_12325 [Meiothermus sp.]|nr:hypothetical protein [Meiothermus sp.]
MFERKLGELLELQTKVRHLHPLFEEHYSVVLVETYRIVSYRFENGAYKLHRIRPNIEDWPTTLPLSLPAAFSVQILSGEVACVAKAESLDDIAGKVMMLHEFVHCHQARTCYHKLAESLEIVREGEAARNENWMLNFPFPYDHPSFVDSFYTYLESTPETLLEARRRVLQTLTPKDREYMVWQEWMEGFARHLENRIQQFLGLPLNLYAAKLPFNRVSFYASGAKTIGHLTALEPALETDLESLYHQMNQRW